MGTGDLLLWTRNAKYLSGWQQNTTPIVDTEQDAWLGQEQLGTFHSKPVEFHTWPLRKLTNVITH